MAKAKIDGLSKIKNKLESQFEDFSKSVANDIVDAIANDMAKEYQFVISSFYDEYTPTKYVRHRDRGMKDGLSLSYRKFKISPHGTYYGGIEITSRNMYKDYRDSREDVLDSFLSGYHGRPGVHIESSIDPLRHMERFRNFQIANIDSYIDSAIKKNKSKRKYSMLKVF